MSPVPPKSVYVVIVVVVVVVVIVGDGYLCSIY